MKSFLFSLLILVSFTNVSCSQKSTTFDGQLALSFLDEYSKFGTNTRKFVAKSDAVTKEFKREYEKLHADARKADPELGLDHDPIFNAQDWPDKGFEIASLEEETGIVILKAKDWPEVFKIEIRMVLKGNQWKIDGAGAFRD